MFINQTHQREMRSPGQKQVLRCLVQYWENVLTRDGGDCTTFFPALKDLILTFGSVGGTETGMLQNTRQRQIQQQKTSSLLQEGTMVSSTLKSPLLQRKHFANAWVGDTGLVAPQHLGQSQSPGTRELSS